MDLEKMTLLRALGKSRMGAVKLYREGDVGENVEGVAAFTAVKFIDRKSASTPGNAKRIFSEKKSLVDLSKHPYIVQLKGTGKDEEWLYFYMKPLLGGALHKHFRAEIHGRFASNKSKHYTAQIASALAYLHSKSYVHRDLKASNVLLDERGNAVLADFGFARRVEEGEKAMSFVGTFHAMAPEVMGKSGHGFEVDWWSLGVLLYEMMTGSPPFGYGVGAEREECEIRVKVGGEGVEFEEGIFSGVGASGKDLVLKLLMVNVADRLTNFQVLKKHEFFEVLRWSDGGEDGEEWVEIGNEAPEFNEDIGDLEILEEVGVGEVGSGMGCEERSDENNPFAGF